MPHVDRTLSIEVTARQLWELVADPLRFGDWLTLHRSWVGGPPRELRAGTRASAVVAVLGIPLTIQWTVLRYDAPQAVRLRGAGPAGIEVEIALDIDERDGDRSALTIGAQITGDLVSGPLGPALENAALLELDRSLERLAALLGP